MFNELNLTKNNVKQWMNNVVKQEEIDKYLINGKDFIDDKLIEEKIKNNVDTDKSKIREIIAKAYEIERLDPDETAALLNLKDDDLWQEIYEVAGKIKKKVYDNRIVTFAPLYCGNKCVNNCEYCGFRKDNSHEKRRILTMDEVKKETESLIKLGHKRLIVVYGEHPETDADYIADSIDTIYKVKLDCNGSKNGLSQIRRVNINAAPMSIEDLKKLWQVGIGTYQVFQETYHHDTFKHVHPSGIKANYRWRLYALHRAMDAGIDDVAVGALFGLYDWKFEVMGLLYHTIDLEYHFNIGPHTVSFPRLTPASGSIFAEKSPYHVSDSDFKKLVAVLRLSIPYCGMIITARESEQIRKEIMALGCTQTDASTRIGIGSYSEEYDSQKKERQQFMLGDTRSLDELVREQAKKGIIMSFCTAGYRCGRTGDKIMELLKDGHEGRFCKLNAILTYKEWIDDFATEKTKQIAEKVLQKEINEVKNDPWYIKTKLADKLDEYYRRISNGERDLYL